MKYERLTVNSASGLKLLKGKKYVELLADKELTKKALNRLADLEDKIENGTLIELPCNVGDTVYHISGKNINEEVVAKVDYDIHNGEIDLYNSTIYTNDIYDKEDNFYRLGKFGKSVFLTREEAEKRLEELNGDKYV